ncbi:ESX-1 secretion-associated protein [Amycolatopsis rhizosphaerae]|uniref:ESX-1 secretion-associated protein n=1 Tax=Amycolatopsis rhizosphaerae TaxID=2053003 RepID=A0A558APW9_9PSEU|nr:type VII secretion target [Amycolatopsis rhizosphaerae]TVT26314.1 ESX-1 secretion-associated protein [Amycolatopsis rhizosphaerae]
MSFTVVPDELRAHASHLDGLVDRLDTAVAAANQVAMDDKAYGVLCAFLPPIVRAVTQNDATDALKAAVDGMKTTADNVRTAAGSYDEQDQTNAAPFEAQLREDDTTASTPARNPHLRFGVVAREAEA